MKCTDLEGTVGGMGAYPHLSRFRIFSSPQRVSSRILRFLPIVGNQDSNFPHRWLAWTVPELCKNAATQCVSFGAWLLSRAIMVLRLTHIDPCSNGLGFLFSVGDRWVNMPRAAWSFSSWWLLGFAIWRLCSSCSLHLQVFWESMLQQKCQIIGQVYMKTYKKLTIAIRNDAISF